MDPNNIQPVVDMIYGLLNISLLSQHLLDIEEAQTMR